MESVENADAMHTKLVMTDLIECRQSAVPRSISALPVVPEVLKLVAPSLLGFRFRQKEVLAYIKSI